MELFDVVDENDRVIGQRMRAEVHSLKLRHRAVHVFLFRSDGCLLIHLRTASKEEFPSVWTSSASGHVSAGESYDSAVVRELREELGIESSLHRLQKFDACPETSLEFTTLYQAKSAASLTVESSEIAAVQWLQPEEIARRVRDDPNAFSPAFRLLFAWYFENSDKMPQG